MATNNGRDKTASPVVYLMEELGDARLRCDQLVRYIEDGAKLIEKSKHKDHLFEIAGHLIHGVPQTVLKLQRALQAVALAAGKIDQEELKRTLRPEKVKELDRVLEDVRIRQVQRRGEPFANLTRRQAAEELRLLAKTIRLAGSFPHHGVAQLISGLEIKDEVEPPDVADGMERLAEALEGPDEDKAPSRVLLASTLRRMLGDACAEDFRGEGEIMTKAEEWKMDNDTETPPFGRGGGRRGGPGANKPDGTGPQGEGPQTGLGKGPCRREADWKAGKKDAALGPGRIHGLMDASLIVSSIKSAFIAWERGEHYDPLEQMAEWFGVLDRAPDGVFDDDTIREGKALARRFPPVRKALFDLMLDADNWFFGVEKEAKASWKTAKDDDKYSRWKKDEKVPMDELTKGMSDEDKAKWKAENEKHKDKFKKDASLGVDEMHLFERMVDVTERQLKEMKHSLGMLKRDPGKYAPQEENFASAVLQVMKMGKIALRASYGPSFKFAGMPKDRNLAQKNRDKFKKNAVDYSQLHAQLVGSFGDGKKQAELLVGRDDEAMNEDRIGWAIEQMRKDANGLKRDAEVVEHYADNNQLTHVGRVFRDLAGNLSATAYWMGYVAGMAGAPGTEGYGVKTAKDDDKSSKFEEGKPADPTKNMSPEDAKKWKAENEKHKDKFKKDAAELFTPELAAGLNKWGLKAASQRAAWKTKNAGRGADDALKFQEYLERLKKLNRAWRPNKFTAALLAEAKEVLNGLAGYGMRSKWLMQRLYPIEDDFKETLHRLEKARDQFRTLEVIIDKSLLGIAQDINPDEAMTAPEWEQYKQRMASDDWKAN